MKQLLKKMLLVLMVSIGMMGAVSVQAQTQEKVWVRVSDFYIPFNATDRYGPAPVDELCRYRLSIYEGGRYTYSGWEFSNKDVPTSHIVCHIAQTEGVWFSGIMAGIVCLADQEADYKRMGCYERVDNCPTGTVPGAGDVCVVPEFPPNHSSCSIGYSDGSRYHGVVACDDQGNRYECAWVDGVKDPEARKILHRCIIRHESLHIDFETYKVYDNYCRDGLLRSAAPARYEQEYRLNGDTIVCLMEGRNKECTTDACRKEIDDNVGNTDDSDDKDTLYGSMSHYAKKYCEETGNKSSSIITCK